MRIPRKLALGAAVLALVISACTPGEGESPRSPEGGSRTPEISIGSAGFPEAALVAEIYAQALEAHGFTVDRHLELGERPAVRAAFDSANQSRPDYLGGLAAFARGDVRRMPSDRSASRPSRRSDRRSRLLAGNRCRRLRRPPGDRRRAQPETMSDLADVAGQLVWGLATGCPENPSAARPCWTSTASTSARSISSR